MQMTKPQPSFDKDLYDACMKQADYFAGRWDSRKDFEWKFSVSLWTLLALGCGFLAGKGQYAGIPWSLVIVPLILHFRWLMGVWVANDFDKHMARAFTDAAQIVLGGGCFAVPLRPERLSKWYQRLRYAVFGTFRDWSMSFQLLCTFLLALVLVWLTHVPIPQPSAIIK